jgi:hypothetical protein
VAENRRRIADPDLEPRRPFRAQAPVLGDVHGLAVEAGTHDQLGPHVVVLGHERAQLEIADIDQREHLAEHREHRREPVMGSAVGQPDGLTDLDPRVDERCEGVDVAVGHRAVDALDYRFIRVV